MVLKDGFIFRIARGEHAEPLTRLLGDSFAHEPMSLGLGLTAQENQDFTARFIPECTSNGLSVIAVPEETPDTLVGALISRDFKSPLPPRLREDFPRFEPILEGLERVDARYEAQVPGLRPGQGFHMWMGGVDQSSRYARRGILRRLFQVSMAVAAERGFQRCIGECTSDFSQRCALSMGFEERVSIDYRDFLFQGRRVFASIPAPHTRVVVYERVLSRAWRQAGPPRAEAA